MFIVACNASFLCQQTFLGQKYGYRPFPPRIMHSEFEAMLAVVQNESDKELLKKWFKRDDNIVPAMHILQPIRELIPNYNNREVSTEERSKASGEWWTAFETMQQLLRVASKDASLKKAEISKYLISGIWLFFACLFSATTCLFL